MINKEKRYIQLDKNDLQMRAFKDANSGKMIIEGYASVFNQRSKLIFENGKMFNEIIERTAFDKVLKRKDIDVLLTYQHNGNEVMARFNPAKGVNTLQLSVDKKGLKYKAELADTTLNRDVYSNIQAGNLYENSFVFTVDKQGERWEKDKEGNHTRYISSISGLFDASVVVNASYSNTDVAVAQRKLEEADDVVEEETELTQAELKEQIKAEILDKVIEIFHDSLNNYVDKEEVKAESVEEEEVINERELDKMFLELMKLR